MVALAPRDRDLRTVGERIERLLDQLEAVAQPRVRDQAQELVRLVTELYGGALARVVELTAQAADEGAGAGELPARLAADELVGGLMAMHGIHPDPLEERVQQALERVGPLLAQHGGGVELVDIDEHAGAVLLRLLGSCDGCAASTVTLQQAVEHAILESAPEIAIIDVEQPAQAVADVKVTLGPKRAYDECPSAVAT